MPGGGEQSFRARGSQVDLQAEHSFKAEEGAVNNVCYRVDVPGNNEGRDWVSPRP